MKRNGKFRLAALTAAALMLLPGMTVCADGTYTTKAGDNLSKIAKAAYGDEKKWKDIYESNKEQIKDPNVLFANQVLTLPGEAAVTAQETTAADAQAAGDAQTAADAQAATEAQAAADAQTAADVQAAAQAQAAADAQAAAQAQQQISAAEEINAYQGKYEVSWEGTYENEPTEFSLSVSVKNEGKVEDLEFGDNVNDKVYHAPIYDIVTIYSEIIPKPEEYKYTGSGTVVVSGSWSSQIGVKVAPSGPESIISLGGGSFQISGPNGGAATLTFAPDGSGVSVSAKDKNYENEFAAEHFAARVAE